ncbi:hypothetical protein Taro_050078 [Colocasia esculenta]|uniref:Uncharacterized protein n=1 Tax=Colocasia esculenta TaxID=4460 RepID=A0A843XCJ1_COLES|nr:hypothetical protein [Colocasia esculenta]
MVPKKSLLMRFSCRIAKEAMSNELVEQLTTLPLPPDVEEENISVPAPKAEEDTEPRGASQVRVTKARSSMEIYMKDRDRMAFRECHKMLMRSTLFSFYVDNTSACAFSMRMLEDIISTYIGGNIFLLGKKEVLFTVEDVGIILGLPSFGHPVCHYDSSKKKSRLHERFGVATNFDRKKVWFLEHTRVRQPINRMAYPRLFRWGTFADKTSPFPIASLTGQQRQIEEIMRYIHKRDEPVTHEEGAAGPTPTFSEHVDVQPPMMHDDPVTQQEWAAWPPTFSQYVADVQPPMTNDDQAPPIGHLEEVPTTTVEEVDAQNPNSMVRAIKEREDRCPSVYDQSLYVRVKNPVTMSEKEKVVATTVRRMLTEYGAFSDATKWELHFENQCPQQASGSLNCAIYPSESRIQRNKRLINPMSVERVMALFVGPTWTVL